ncbi:MAG TPA: DUF2332 domain-containing protein [Pseudolysinimonas sp.]|nr:DUF2332 domain-containing protein [Pseudolysinimonas sp.]
MASDAAGTSAWYARAAVELAGTSELQVDWAHGIAADPDVLALLDELPREHRQPSLIFSVARWLGAPAEPWAGFRPWLIAEWPRVAAAARERRTQTNEVGRCAPLLAALDRIPGPLALVELGSAAGLCLGVDRYSYRFGDGERIGEGEPLLTCALSGEGAAPRGLPQIVSRAGVDLRPLDLADAEDVGWLEALLPADRPERLERLRAAIATLREDPPEVVEGDALERLPALAAAAPAGATLVVVSLGTLVYLAPADRARVVERCAALGARLVTLEPLSALPELAVRLEGLTAPEPTPFLLALDGIPLAFAGPHGDRLSWLSAVRQPG